VDVNRHHDFGGYNHPLLRLVILMLIVAGIAALTAFLITRFSKRHAPPPPPMGRHPMAGPDPALEHARVRYARGEMSREEYLQVVSDLTGAPAPPGNVSPPGPTP